LLLVARVVAAVNMLVLEAVLVGIEQQLHFQ
jgi:hypothetical protein